MTPLTWVSKNMENVIKRGEFMLWSQCHPDPKWMNPRSRHTPCTYLPSNDRYKDEAKLRSGKQFGNCFFVEDGEMEPQEDMSAMVKKGHEIQQGERVHSLTIKMGGIFGSGGIFSYFSVGATGHRGENRADPCSIIYLVPKLNFPWILRENNVSHVSIMQPSKKLNWNFFSCPSPLGEELALLLCLVWIFSQ